MSDKHDIAEVMNVLLCFGLKKEDITILQCNMQYPTPWRDVNLRACLHY